MTIETRKTTAAMHAATEDSDIVHAEFSSDDSGICYCSDNDYYLYEDDQIDSTSTDKNTE